jgi:hypothetical protein
MAGDDVDKVADATKEIVREALQVDTESILTRNIFCYRKDTDKLEVLN